MKAILRNAVSGHAITLSAGQCHVTISDSLNSARCSSLPELTGTLGKFTSRTGTYEAVFGNRPQPASAGHAMLLLALSSRWPNIKVSSGGRQHHHLTLAYALPAALDRSWREWAARCSPALVRGRQLVAVPASDLVAVEPGKDLAYRHRRLLRQHARTVVREHDDCNAFLAHWSAFTRWRHKQAPTSDEQDALYAILAMSSSRVREFIACGEVIARSVICCHDSSRTVFDLMATWEPRHARYRPGIYSGVYNIMDAARQGYRFSMCYGQFAYKDDIVGASPRLSLEDLISSASRDPSSEEKSRL